VKFHTVITCSYLNKKANLIFSYCCKVTEFFADKIMICHILYVRHSVMKKKHYHQAGNFNFCDISLTSAHGTDIHTCRAIFIMCPLLDRQQLDRQCTYLEWTNTNTILYYATYSKCIWAFSCRQI